MTVKVTKTKMLGKIPVLYRFCERMHLPQIIDEIVPEKPWADNSITIGQLITVLVINRLTEPIPFYKVIEWIEKTGFSELLHVSAEYFTDDRLARALDYMFIYWEKIMNKVVMFCIEAFSIDPSLIHYDITSLYFEGRYEDSDFITYGYNRDQKPDKKQVNLGINMLDKEPFPLLWQLFPGNKNDTDTVIKNLDALRSLLGTQPFTFIGDRAMISEDIVKYSRKYNVSIIAPLKDMLSTTRLLETIKKEDLVESIGDKKKESEIYKLGEYEMQYSDDVDSPDIRAVVVWSKTKAETIKLQREKKINNRVENLKILKEKLNKPYYRKKISVEKKISKIMKNDAINDLFTVQLAGSDRALTLEWIIDENAKYNLEQKDGFYILGTTTSQVQLSTLEVFKAYKRQYISESTFKNLKTTIGIRPIFLHIEQRIFGLVQITLLALCVYTLLDIHLKRHDFKITTKRMFELFVGFILIQILLPDKTLEFQVGPLRELELDILKALSLEDTEDWILKHVEQNYSFQNYS